MAVEPAAGVSRTAGPRGQPDVGGEGRSRATPVFRSTAVRQRNAVVLLLPSTRARLHRRASARARFDRADSSAQLDEPRQRGVFGVAHLGRSRQACSRGSGARADDESTSGGDGSPWAREGGARQTPGRARLSGAVWRGRLLPIATRSRSQTFARRSPVSSGRSCPATRPTIVSFGGTTRAP